MSNNKREADAPAAAAREGTPSKRPRIDDGASVAPVPAVKDISQASGATAAAGEAPSSPFNPKETDSPSVRGKKAGGGRGGGRSCGRGGKGGKNGDKPDSRSGRSRNAEAAASKAKKEGWKEKDGAAGKNAEGSAPGAGGDDKSDRLPKRKVAILLGYNGIGYKGSQINPSQATVEGEVFKAFVAAGAVSEDNSTNPQKVSLARAARTDAGVHAAMNVLTLKLILQPASRDPTSTIEEHINTFLPSGVRIWKALRVQGSFDPRRACDQRHYQYTLPTHVFLGPRPGTPMSDMLERTRAETSSSASSSADAEPSPVIEASKAFWSARPQDCTFTDDIQAKKAWRMPQAVLEQAKSFIAAYEGSHNYYNFTVGKDFRDRSCQRVMRKLELSEPFVVNDTEYISVSFLGQSFMLHQIRKMIGLFVLAVRSATPPSLVPETFGPSRIHIPKAPGLGLLLLEPQYIEYNKRVGEANAKLDELLSAGRIDDKAHKDQIRDAIDAAQLGLTDKIEEFKREQVYKRMWDVEEKDLVFAKWLNYLDMYSGPDFEYLNPKGVIPASATYKKGENPEMNRRVDGEQTRAPGEAEDEQDAAAAAEDE